MLNKFSRFIRKFPVLSAHVILTSGGLALAYLSQPGISTVLLLTATVIGISVGIQRLFDILRHGYYGIPVLQLTAALTAILVRELPVAALLTLIVIVEVSILTKTKLYQAKHARIIKLLDTAVLPYTVIVILVGGGMWTITDDVTRFLMVIASASTTSLLLAGPLLLHRRFSDLKRQKFNINSIRSFEELAATQTIVLKKTGVLTEDTMRVSKIEAYGKHTKMEVLSVAAALSTGSSHPIAVAISEHASTKTKIDRAKHTVEVLGQGITGRMKGHDYTMGRLSYLQNQGIEVPIKAADSAEVAVFVAVDGSFIGVILLQETMRSGIRLFKDILGKTGIKNVILASGSNTKPTVAVAKAAGISTAYGELVQADIINLLQKSDHKPVLYIGNDQQDEAILPQSDISISTNPNLLTAPVEIPDYTPQRLLHVLLQAKATFKTTQRLVVFGLSISLIFVLIAATGKLSPLYAVLANLAITGLVLLLTTVPKEVQLQE